MLRTPKPSSCASFVTNHADLIKYLTEVCTTAVPHICKCHLIEIDMHLRISSKNPHKTGIKQHVNSPMNVVISFGSHSMLQWASTELPKRAQTFPGHCLSCMGEFVLTALHEAAIDPTLPNKEELASDGVAGASGHRGVGTERSNQSGFYVSTGRVAVRLRCKGTRIEHRPLIIACCLSDRCSGL